MIFPGSIRGEIPKKNRLSELCKKESSLSFLSMLLTGHDWIQRSENLSF